MWWTIIATNGNCSIFFNNDSRVLLEKQHNQQPKYKRNSRKTKVDQNEVINKDKNGRPRKCTSSLLSGNDSEALVIFMNMLIACYIGVEIVNDFFQRQRCAVGKEELLANCNFFPVWLYLYVPRENNCMIQCNEFFFLVVSYLKFQKIQMFNVLFCKKKKHNCSVFKCSCMA